MPERGAVGRIPQSPNSGRRKPYPWDVNAVAALAVAPRAGSLGWEWCRTGLAATRLTWAVAGRAPAAPAGRRCAGRPAGAAAALAGRGARGAGRAGGGAAGP